MEGADLGAKVSLRNFYFLQQPENKNKRSEKHVNIKCKVS